MTGLEKAKAVEEALVRRCAGWSQAHDYTWATWCGRSGAPDPGVRCEWPDVTCEDCLRVRTKHPGGPP